MLVNTDLIIELFYSERSVTMSCASITNSLNVQRAFNDFIIHRYKNSLDYYVLIMHSLQLYSHIPTCLMGHIFLGWLRCIKIYFIQKFICGIEACSIEPVIGAESDPKKFAVWLNVKLLELTTFPWVLAIRCHEIGKFNVVTSRVSFTPRKISKNYFLYQEKKIAQE